MKVKEQFFSLFKSECEIKEEILQYENIRSMPSKSVLMDEPLQSGNCISVKPLSFFRDRYATLLHQVLDALPISSSDRDTLIIPLIDQLIRWTHMLPASEWHHHRRPCGLFEHSLQCAYYAIQLASYSVPVEFENVRQKHRDRERWVVAAAVMMLIHDAGKVFNVKVCADGMDFWNPNAMSLLQWSEARATDNYYLTWIRGRGEKSHELASIRLAYEHLFSFSLIQYLSRFDDSLLSAIEEAIVFKRGPLFPVLIKSESMSIEDDRKIYDQGTVISVVSPSVSAILKAMKSLITQQDWKINEQDGSVFVTEQGVFVRLTAFEVEGLIQAMKKMATHSLPATDYSIAKVLFEANTLLCNEKTSEEDNLFWEINLTGNKRIFPCILFKVPFILFELNALPVSIGLKDSPKAWQKQGDSLNVSSDHPRESQDIQQEIKVAETVRQRSVPKVKRKEGDCLSDKEVHQVLESSLPDNQLPNFLDRLLNTVVRDSLTFQGLAKNIISDNEVSCLVSSLPLEEVLENTKISRNLVKIFAGLRKEPPRISIDFSHHVIEISKE